MGRMTDQTNTPPQTPPMRVAIIPVTPLQQNCSLIWCTETMRGAFVDAGGDLERLRRRRRRWASPSRSCW
jgi:hydroxyacylglutathione hydrolase